MYISVLMTIHFIIGHAHICTNAYFIPNFFPMRFCKTGIFSYFLDFC